MNNFHKPVLLQPVLDYLQIHTGENYIDATIGGGGHTAAILDRGGIVLGIDQDTDALKNVTKNFELKIQNLSLTLAYGNFRNLEKIAQLHGITQFSGILFDLGVSSFQLNRKERGFSFQKEAELDMRMDENLSVSAADLINGLSKNELTLLFQKYGEEHQARRFANIIVTKRTVQPITTTKELSDILVAGSIFKHSKIHPATRVFQALRIAVNDELFALEEALPQAVRLLSANGRLAVITFHSLEDRMVKHQFADFEQQNIGRVVTKKPVQALEEEIADNHRSRSAKLRVFEKL